MLNEFKKYNFYDSVKLSNKLLVYGKKIDKISIKDLKSPKTLILLEEAKDYLYLYKEKVPDDFKPKIEFCPEDLENKINNIEELLK